MSVAVDKFDYQLPYEGIFGGVSAISVKHFNFVNGFSNQFWGWGGEDDDLYCRVTRKNVSIVRYIWNLSIFFIESHNKIKV